MFGIGFPELILILALALIVVGPDKLPELARSIAKTLVDLKKTAEGLKNSIQIEDNPLSEIKPKLEDAAKNFKESILDAETQTGKTSLETDSSQVQKNIHDIYDDYAELVQTPQSSQTADKAASDTPAAPEQNPPEPPQEASSSEDTRDRDK